MKKKKISISLAIFLAFVLLCGCIFTSYANQEEAAKKDDAVTEKVIESENKATSKKEDVADDKVLEAKVEETSTQHASAPAEVKDGTTAKQETQTATSNDQASKKSTTVKAATSNSQETKSSSAEQHTHNWVKSTTTVHHDATGHYENVCVKEAWTETVPVYEEVAIEVCGNCGADCTSNPGAHIEEHMLNGTGKYGCHTEYVQKQIGTQTISHPAEYKKQWVVDKEAWDETVVTYKCSCGASK